jgi:D-alanine--poly(phosphoribitol) ligase subunit 2
MDELLDLLKRVLNIDDGIDEETPLISTGLIDSLGVFGLLVELETQYGVVVEPEEIDAATFDTPRQILARVAG